MKSVRLMETRFPTHRPFIEPWTEESREIILLKFDEIEVAGIWVAGVVFACDYGDIWPFRPGGKGAGYFWVTAAISAWPFNLWLVHSGFSQVGIVPDDATGRRIFSGISRFPALSFRRCSILTSLRAQSADCGFTDGIAGILLAQKTYSRPSGGCETVHQWAIAVVSIWAMLGPLVLTTPGPVMGRVWLVSGATSGPAMVPGACQLSANCLPAWHPTFSSVLRKRRRWPERRSSCRATRRWSTWSADMHYFRPSNTTTPFKSSFRLRVASVSRRGHSPTPRRRPLKIPSWGIFSSPIVVTRHLELEVGQQRQQLAPSVTRSMVEDKDGRHSGDIIHIDWLCPPIPLLSSVIEWHPATRIEVGTQQQLLTYHKMRHDNHTTKTTCVLAMRWDLEFLQDTNKQNIRLLKTYSAFLQAARLIETGMTPRCSFRETPSQGRTKRNSTTHGESSRTVFIELDCGYEKHDSPDPIRREVSLRNRGVDATMAVYRRRECPGTHWMVGASDVDGPAIRVSWKLLRG
ncbi:hypothetical protein PR048_015675 [Dryococelus australis]|uniref:Uncharacterized protein n=1 Tax=Dryococelus australis TaxID=614101 RepID=A0ABQ9HHS0_9NEOP|nr:hypothetical protein PR048_015675 [Dryococelus australis]